MESYAIEMDRFLFYLSKPYGFHVTTRDQLNVINEDKS